MAGENEQHIYHHNDNDAPKVNVSVEKNTKGYNWSATIVGASTVEQAIEMVVKANQELTKKFGIQQEA